MLVRPDEAASQYERGPDEESEAQPAVRACDDAERVRDHPLGSDGSCHTCAMALDENFELLPERESDYCGDAEPGRGNF